MVLVPRPNNADIAAMAHLETPAINLVVPGEQAAGPGVLDVIGAAARLDNPIVSLFSQIRAEDDEPDPNYDWFAAIRGTPYEAHSDRFATTAFNAAQGQALMRQIDREAEDRRTRDAAGGWGLVATLGVSMFSPEIFLPGGAIYRGARASHTIARTALSTASYATLSSAVAEAGLQMTQETRPIEESIFNIGGGAILGGILGGGIAALISRRDWARFTAAANAEIRQPFDAIDPQRANEDAIGEGLARAGDAGAAARPVDTLEDLSVAGQAANVAGRSFAFMNPVLRTLYSPSVAVRDIATKLYENPIYLRKNFEGQASAPGVETLVKEFTRGRMATATEQHRAAYNAFRQAGGTLNPTQFSEAVGQAMRRADASTDPSITRAAELWRREVLDPLKDRAIEAGLLRPDVSVDTALSYFTRVYNRPLMQAQEQRFKGIVRQWADDQVGIALNASRSDDPGADFGFVSASDRDAYVREIAENVYNTLMGKNADGDIPRDIVAATRGPLKERTFNIPDHLIEEFLESDVEKVARFYARTMASDIELTRQFGKADMAEQIEAITREYADMRARVEADKDAAGNPKNTPRQQIESMLNRLNKREKDDIRDVRALRDLVRGAYLAEANSTNYARIARVAGTLNYLRSMGGVTVSSLSDVARPLMVHGLSNVMGAGLRPLISNMRGFKMSVAEAKRAGAVVERVLNTRLATWADITDPYAASSPFERFMDNTAALFSKMNGMVYWNDAMKSFSSVITQDRILRGAGRFGALDKRERAYLAYLGIDGNMAERINRQFELHGSIEEGDIRVAGTDDWTDAEARTIYRAAINKDVDTTVVTRGVGDVPLFMHTPTGRLVGQFKSFALASHQRMLMRGLQERPAGFVSGVMVATTLGMMIYVLKAIESNRMDDISDNPGRWIAEGLDRSGIFALAFEVNNTVEKALGVGAYGALSALFPDRDQDGKSSRYMMRSTAAGFFGPTADFIDTLVRAVQGIQGVATGEGMSEGDINAIRRLAPFATLPGIRSLVEYLGVPAVLEAVN